MSVVAGLIGSDSGYCFGFDFDSGSGVDFGFDLNLGYLMVLILVSERTRN